MAHSNKYRHMNLNIRIATLTFHFSLTAGGMVAPPQPRLAPRAPDLEQLNQDKWK